MDGASGSQVERYLREDGRCRWWSEEDAGLYEAMNNGLIRASGRWVLWLNGGDVLERPEVLEELLLELTLVEPDGHQFPAVMCNAAYQLGDGTRVSRRAKPAWYVWHGMPSLHQAIAYPRAQASAYPYPDNLRICGDYFLTASLYRAGIRYVRSDLALVRFGVGGLSFQDPSRLLKEAAWVQAEVLGVPSPLRRLSGHLRRMNISRLRSRQTRATRP
jgi:putative colanic acid biosynthesis glycosyltransferase